MKTKPRRKPRTPQGEAIHEALLEAASTLLVKRGLAALTTNAVAELAGVSVGSLYQYFPGKQAIVAAVAARLNARFLTRLGAALSSPASPRERLDAALLAFVAGSEADAALRRALFVDTPRAWREAGVAEAEQRAADLLLPLARELRPDVSETTLRSGLMCALFAARAVFLATVTYHPEELGSPVLLERLRGVVLASLGGKALTDSAVSS